jgi:hypothetical protein
MAPRDIPPRTFRATEIYGDYWFNSEPVPIIALRGSVILLCFWDYACCGSLRMMSYVCEWYRRYRNEGLVIVGVHSPKFPFGQDPGNVQKALHSQGIQFPVVMDNGYLIWARYQNRVRPAVHIIDRDGFVRYVYDGEGGYLSTEREIQLLLGEAGYAGELPDLMEPLRETDRPGVVLYRPTPELFAGYQAGTVGNVEGGIPESVSAYEDPGIYLDGRFYLEGDWLSQRESLRHEGAAGPEGRVILTYSSLGVGAVCGGEGKTGVRVAIEQDGTWLTASNKGRDVSITPDGVSYLEVQEPRLHSLVENREFGSHLLRLKEVGRGFVLYSFCFQSGVIPEFVPHR